MARTMIRDEILGMLQHSHALSVQEFLAELKEIRPSVNKTTVYRALEQLESEGAVCRQSFREAESVYELRDDHHDHAQCTSCGKVISVPCTSVSAPNQIQGFHVDHHHLTYYGKCASCAKK